MIIFHIIQNISYFLEEKMMYTKNLTSVTLSGRLEKVYDGIFLSVENIRKYDDAAILIIIMVFRCDSCLIIRHLDNNFKKTQSS